MEEYNYFARLIRLDDPMIYYVLCHDMEKEPRFFFVQMPEHLAKKLEETSKGTRVELERLGEIVAKGEGYLPDRGVKDYLFMSHGVRIPPEFADHFDL